MYPFGHFALAYFFAKIIGILDNEEFNLLILWFVSIIPDFDFLLTQWIPHRGPTHSLITMILALLPILLIFRRGWKYSASLLSHLLGDYITYPGIQILWPLSNDIYVAPSGYAIPRDYLLQIEFGIFVLSLVIYYYTEHRYKM
jgi:membrane-bound metal-dependent hydrolase YbcI (DUF457 family)